MERSPTDTLVHAMEQAGTAKQLLVIMTSEDGHILTLGTTDQRVIRLGLIEAAKQWMIADMVAESVAGEGLNMQLGEEQIKHMANRFLGWRLPDNFNPDGGVRFERFGNAGTEHQYVNSPTGTNLLDAGQAEEMIRFIVQGMPDAPSS